MHTEDVEIYSDKTNSAVLRHPGRRFPGVLIQGDTLSALCFSIHEVCIKAQPQLDAKTLKELDRLRTSLIGFLTHYRVVLGEHNIQLPFSDIPLFLNR